MRAVVVDAFGPFENAAIREVPDPVPGPADLLVEVHATAANFVDILLMGGRHQSKPGLPFIPGKGPSGVVRTVGAEVSGFAVGDRVVAMCEPGGGFAERIRVPAAQCHRIPSAMPFADAASMALVYDTAWFALRERGRYADGETVLVLGATGGVGLAAVQLAKALGAKVLAGVASPAKAGMVRDAGADTIVDLARDDIHDSLREQVYAATGGRGADIVIDPLGDAIFDAAIRAVAWRGRMVVVGFAAESQDLTRNAKQKLEAKGLSLIVANDIQSKDAGFNVDTNRVTLLDADGGIEELPLLSKAEVAEAVLDRVQRMVP